MQISNDFITPPTAGHGWGGGTVRRGGPDAPPPADVLAQAVVELPWNFGMHVLLDVRQGRELATYGGPEDALRGAADLARTTGRNVGVTEQYLGPDAVAYRAVELLLPNISTVPTGNGPDAWAGVVDVPIRFGRDTELGGRVVEELHAVDRLEDERAARIMAVALSTGGRLEFEIVPSGRRSRLEQSPA